MNTTKPLHEQSDFELGNHDPDQVVGDIVRRKMVVSKPKRPQLRGHAIDLTVYGMNGGFRNTLNMTPLQALRLAVLLLEAYEDEVTS